MSPLAPPPSPPRRRARPAKAAILLTLAVAAVTTLAACSSSSSAPTASASASQASATAQDCTNVGDVLADGPDPDADSAGYAEAQVLPLQQLKISTPAIQSAVTQLDAAYKMFSSAIGSAQTQDAIKVSSAESTLNALCPGVAP